MVSTSIVTDQDNTPERIIPSPESTAAVHPITAWSDTAIRETIFLILAVPQEYRGEVLEGTLSALMADRAVRKDRAVHIADAQRRRDMDEAIRLVGVQVCDE